jgi:hypothetical protein
MMGELFEHLADLTIQDVPSRFGPRDVRVVLIQSEPDGQMVWSGLNFLFVGTSPLPLMEDVRREGRRIVRRGLADVLEWLGESWNDEPTGREVLLALKRGANPLQLVNKHVRAI